MLAARRAGSQPERVGSARLARINRALQLSKRGEHFGIRKIRVASARIRQDEHPGTTEWFLLPAEPDRAALREDRAKQRDTDERDDAGRVAADLAPEDHEAIHVLGRTQRIDSWRRSRDQVRDAKSPLRQTLVVHVRDGFRHEPRVEQELPEPVRVTGEVMTRERGPDTRVDADEQNVHARLDAISKTWQLGGWRHAGWRGGIL